MNERIERVVVTHPEGGESMTKQSMAAATDVNLIMEKWHKHGAAVAHLNRGQAMWGDFSSGVDYAEALNSIRDAQRDFAALPAKVRAHVDNDPGEFLEMVFDPERREELERLGLVDVQKPAGAVAAASGDVREEPGAMSSEELEEMAAEAKVREKATKEPDKS